MRITVWSLTTEGDNTSMETNVFASEAAARAQLIEWLESWGVVRAVDGHPIETATSDELCDLWQGAAEGPCIIDAHELEIAI